MRYTVEMYRIGVLFIAIIIILMMRHSYEGFRMGGHGMSQRGDQRGHGVHYGIAHRPTRHPVYGWNTIGGGGGGYGWWPWMWCDEDDSCILI